jgi:serine protease AprX
MAYCFGKAVSGGAIALALCAPVHAGPPSDRATHKLDHALDRAGDGSHSIIISIRDGAKPGVRRRLEALGHRVLKDHGLVNALTARVDGRGLEMLLSDPDVDDVSLDADVTPTAAPASDPVVSSLKKTLALGNWFSGSSLTIAVIDSGVAETADFTGRILGSYDFTNGQNAVATAPFDEYGHGTHVAGLAGASGAVSNGTYAGVVSGVKLLSLRVLDRKGVGRTSDVISALEFAVANRARFNIRIINLSLGHPIYESATTDPLVRAVEAAVRSGIVVVVAAGNFGVNPQTGLTGYGGVTSPGNAPSAITVGAASNGNTVERGDDRVATFSSRGPTWLDGYGKPDVVAPGYGLLSDSVEGSTLALSYPALVSPATGGKLIKLSGASMATAVVSGLVAVMMEAHDAYVAQRYDNLSAKQKRTWVTPPLLTPNAIKAMLQYSATPLRDAAGVKYDPLTQGTGEVDGLGAMLLAYSADTSQLTGAAWMPAMTPTTQFGAEQQTWAQNIVWGTVSISGTGLIEVNQPAWAAAITWGAGELHNIVWGTADEGEQENIVWGTSLVLADVPWAGSVIEGANIVWGTSLGTWASNIVWGTSIGVLEGTNIVWGTSDSDGENIVWGTLTDGQGDTIVWGTVQWDDIVGSSSSKPVLGWVLTGGAL